MSKAFHSYFKGRGRFHVNADGTRVNLLLSRRVGVLGCPTRKAADWHVVGPEHPLSAYTTLFLARADYGLNGIARLMGAQDVKIGAPEFDLNYIIQGSSEPHIRLIMSELVVRRA